MPVFSSATETHLPAFQNGVYVTFFLLVLIHMLTSEREELDSRGGIILLQ